MQRQEQTLGDQLFDGLQGNESCDATSHAPALPRMRELPHAPTLVA
jgi:hypothetical protein